jgi:L-fuconolactonase
VARTARLIRGIVAQAALENGAVVEPDPVRLAADPLVTGVRRLVHSAADDAFCLRPDFVRGGQLLPRAGLSLDLCIIHRQLANVSQRVRTCPNMRFVLDPTGKPDIKAGLLELWRAERLELWRAERLELWRAERLELWRAERRGLWRAERREPAALPNVSCKVSGLVTEADFGKWTPRSCGRSLPPCSLAAGSIA